MEGRDTEQHLHSMESGMAAGGGTVKKACIVGGGGAEALQNLPIDSSISIAYHPRFGNHDELLLLEIDDNLLPDILQQRVTIRGNPDEEAVLCTCSATYALKFVGTSNSVFLVPPQNSVFSTGEENPSVASVIGVAPGSMELIRVAPKLEKLKSLLTEKLYKPDSDSVDEESKMGLYNWSDLVDRIQASDDELRDGLKALSAVEIDGYWRIVDESFMFDLLTIFFHNAVLHDWSLNALRGDEVVRVLELDGFSRRMILHCLETYGTKVGEEIGGFGVWRLDERLVCLQIARRILNRGKRKMESFMEEWGRSVPSGMHVKMEMLEGEVLMERVGFEVWVRAFSVSSLPSTPADRFASLFRERPKWGWKELEPYIRDLRVPGLSSEGLLIKYTRRTQPTADAEPVFCAR